MSVIDRTPEWSASLSLKALMGDHTPRDCTTSFSYLHFEDERRSIGPMPFAVTLDQRAPWVAVADQRPATSWTVAAHPPQEFVWHDYNDVLVVDPGHRLWHRRLTCGATSGAWESVDSRGESPDFAVGFSMAAVSDPLGRTDLFVLSAGRLLARVRADHGWSEPWLELPVYAEGDVAPVAVSSVSARPLTEGFEGAEICVTGADGQVYLSAYPGFVGAWQRFGVVDFTLALGVAVQVAGDLLIALGTDARLRVRPINAGIFGGWGVVSPDCAAIVRFAVAGAVQLAVAAADGTTWIGELADSGDVAWTRVDGPVAMLLQWVTSSPGQWWLFGCALDGTVVGVHRGDGGPAVWTEVGRGLRADPSGRLVAVSRATGQVEVFASAAGDSAMMRTWWS